MRVFFCVYCSLLLECAHSIVATSLPLSLYKDKSETRGQCSRTPDPLGQHFSLCTT